uniref:Uncharacterized protein n=1 Tax=Arundo donax TaxID=35708 RepID=A0A0A9ARC1_ARUDO
MQFTLLGLCVVIPHCHLCSGIPLVLLAFIFGQSKAFCTFQPGSQQEIIVSG